MCILVSLLGRDHSEKVKWIKRQTSLSNVGVTQLFHLRVNFSVVCCGRCLRMMAYPTAAPTVKYNTIRTSTRAQVRRMIDRDKKCSTREVFLRVTGPSGTPEWYFSLCGRFRTKL